MSNRLKNIIQIPSSMWNTYFQDDKLLTLTYYCQIRALYKHPVILNTNRIQLAKKLKVAYNTLKPHLQYLEARNIITFKNGNVYIMNKTHLQELYPSKNKSLSITTGTISQTKKSVKAIPIYSKLRLQLKFINKEVKKQALTRLSENSYLKSSDSRWLNKEKKINRSTYFNFITLSNKRIAQLTGNTSSSSGVRYKKVLKDLGLIDYQRRFQIISDRDINKYFDGYRHTLNGAFFLNGILMKEAPNQFRLKGEKFITFNLEGNKSYSSEGLRKFISS